MKIYKILSFIALIIVLNGCGLFNKTQKTVVVEDTEEVIKESEIMEKPTSDEVITPTPAKNKSEFTKPANGVYPPGIEEVNALKPKFSDITLASLQQGHQIYSAGACTNCHKPKNIYNIDPSKWDQILTNMASKAKLNEVEKDAVNKYVLSIKAIK